MSKKEKTPKKRLTVNRLLYLIIVGVIGSASLLFSLLFAGTALHAEDPSLSLSFQLFISLAFLFSGLLALTRLLVDRRKTVIIKCSVYATVAIITAGLTFISLVWFNMYLVLACIYFGARTGLHVYDVITTKGIRNKVLPILLTITTGLLFILFILSLIGPEDPMTTLLSLTVVGFIMAINTFVALIQSVLSGVKTGSLMKIIKKSYAAEILAGLLITIVASSIVFTIIEPGVDGFNSALWYCFAIVTTIGFGDIAATSIIGRFLSVMLGIYGIIVVALITSIVVNLYTESSQREKETEETRPTRLNINTDAQDAEVVDAEEIAEQKKAPEAIEIHPKERRIAELNEKFQNKNE